MNNLEISIYKLSTMVNELKLRNDNISLLDLSENVLLRKNDTKLCLERINRIEKQYTDLIAALKDISSSQQTGGNSSEAFERGAVALRNIKEQMESNLEKI